MADAERPPEDVTDASAEAMVDQFTRFLQTAERQQTRRGSSLVPTSGLGTGSDTYLQAVADMVRAERSTLPVDFADLSAFDEDVADALLQEFYRFEPFLRRALHSVVTETRRQLAVPDVETQYFVAFFNMPAVFSLRSLRSEHVGRLVSVSGTVTRTSEVRPELLLATFSCLECGTLNEQVEQQFKYTEPPRCLNPTCTNRSKWQLVTENSIFVDWQRLRVQENSEEIPAGSMPRSLDVILRHDNVERVKPGDKCQFTGTLIAVPDVAQLLRPGQTVRGVSRGSGRRTGDNGMAPGEGVTGLKQLGVRDLTYKLAFLVSGVQQAHDRTGGLDPSSSVLDGVDGAEGEANRDVAAYAARLPRHVKDRVREMKEMPNLYQRMARSIAPAVCGHDEIKRGVLLLLLGGVHKRTAEGTNLRGDVNLCIVGDPSTAKSQFLKWVTDFMPRAIYTSGKASSAAGLTASVARDPDTGEFAIEAGALMLADNGICCIDEFDKMDPADQVAIHEAMEQQTISITKAGIQATLNARASILAAANPVFGRYDKTKTLRQNVTLTAPIMSRFDLFFVVLDEGDEAVDERIARHIVLVHQTRNRSAPLQDTEFTIDDLRQYIALARHISPVITPESQLRMIQLYKRLRANDSVGAARSSYRITVRQLESMIRLSEALARLHLSTKILPAYVDEAYRLLRKSIIHVETGDEVTLPMGSTRAPSFLRDRQQRADAQQRPAMGEEGAEAEGAAEAAPEAGGEGEDRAAEGEAAPGPARRGAFGQQPRATMTLSEYRRIAVDVVELIRQQEPEEGHGVQARGLIATVLEREAAAAPMGTEELAARRRLLSGVLRRMREVDRVLVIGNADSLELPDDDEELLLTVHPDHFGAFMY